MDAEYADELSGVQRNRLRPADWHLSPDHDKYRAECLGLSRVSRADAERVVSHRTGWPANNAAKPQFAFGAGYRLGDWFPGESAAMAIDAAGKLFLDSGEPAYHRSYVENYTHIDHAYARESRSN